MVERTSTHQASRTSTCSSTVLRTPASASSRWRTPTAPGTRLTLDGHCWTSSRSSAPGGRIPTITPSSNMFSSVRTFNCPLWLWGQLGTEWPEFESPFLRGLLGKKWGLKKHVKKLNYSKLRSLLRSSSLTFLCGSQSNSKMKRLECSLVIIQVPAV